MGSSPPFSDSPQGSAFIPLQANEGAVQLLTQAVTKSTTDTHRGGSDRFATSPGNAIPPSPYRSTRNEQGIISSSSSPSQRGLLATRLFPPSEAQDASPLTAEGSGKNSFNQRVSFESTPASASTLDHSPRPKVLVHPLLRDAASQSAQGTGPPMEKSNRSSDPTRPSSLVRLAGAVNSSQKPRHESPPTASAPHSRGTSPIRLFSWPGFHRSHEDPFVPVNPFRVHPPLRHLSFHGPDIESSILFNSTCEENLLCIPPCTPEDRIFSFFRDAQYFALDTLPRQIYLHLLLRLPSLYFSRIARVYEDAQLSKPDLDRMVESYSSSRQQQQRERIVHSSPIPPGAHYHPARTLPFPDDWTAANVSSALIRFKLSWEAFIDSLMREWKTLNLVSALLLSAIVSMFQIQEMANDPIIRTAALLSLTSALMSLSFGCIYIVRFGTMRSMYKATRWAEEAARTTTFIIWNVWVPLAMPAVWLAWSMIFFVIAILAFVWQYGSAADHIPDPLSPTAAIGPRVAVSALFFLGLVYLAAIVKTLHNYGRTSEHRIFGRAAARDGMPDPQNDTGGREQGTQRGREGDESTHASRGRERARRGNVQDLAEPGGLSAVTGLGLTGLDDIASPHNDLNEMPEEKRQQQREASV